MDGRSLETVSTKKQQQNIERDKPPVSRIVRYPVLTLLESLAADLAWNG